MLQLAKWKTYGVVCAALVGISCTENIGPDVATSKPNAEADLA